MFELAGAGTAQIIGSRGKVMKAMIGNVPTAMLKISGPIVDRVCNLSAGPVGKRIRYVFLP